MKINIPKILVAVDLGEYAAALAGNVLQVWVNPPLHIMQAHTEINQAETPDQKEIFAWYAKQWSQGTDPDGHWSVAELEELQKNDPALLAWMINATWQSISSHRFMKKKA